MIILTDILSNILLLAQVDITKIAAQLGDVIEPDAVQFSFETIGWKLLFVVIYLLILIVFVVCIKLYIKNRFKRIAINNIKQINNENNTVKEIIANIKIVAIKSFGREKVANLWGSEWLDFLTKTAKNTDFIKYKDIINKAIYKDEIIDKKSLIELKHISIKWIKTHNVRDTKYTR